MSRSGPQEDVHDQIDVIAGQIKGVLDVAKGFNVRLALENHATLSSEEILHVVKSIDDDFVRVCLDTMNSIVLMEHPLETVRMLAPYAITVHLKDFKIEKLPRYHRIVGVPLGEGFVDFLQIMQILRESQADPNIHLELYIDRKEGEQETVQWENDCVVKSLQYARENLL